MLQEGVDLKAYNTFGLSVKAELFGVFRSVEQLKELLSKRSSQNLLILGGGSNLLLTQDVKGIVLKNELLGIEVLKRDQQQVWIKAQGGEIWHNLVLYCIENNFGGIENLSLIPGSVGAAPMQNIGAYGVEIKDVFESLEAINISTGELQTFNTAACEFGYRESVFKRKLKDQYVITSVTLRLSENQEVNTSYGAIQEELAKMGISKPTIKNVSDAVIKIRQSKLPDPKEIGNSGSFFKNPVVSKIQLDKLKIDYPSIANYPLDDHQVKLAAGWLIEHAGWKGKTIDNYGVHKNQALVLVNYGGAKGEDIYQLSEDIMASVFEKYGVQLEREVNVI